MSEYEFFVQCERWVTNHPSMSALALKYFVRVGANYACHQESPVSAMYRDNDSVDLTNRPRFIFVPPANL